MELTVLSILTTTPLRNPCEGWDPMPIISTPRSVISPTTAQTFELPMSKPTTMRCFFAMMLCCNLRDELSYLLPHPSYAGHYLIVKTRIQSHQTLFMSLPKL